MSAGNEIGDLLLDIGLVTQEDLAKAHEEQAKSGERLTLVLERLGLVSYHQLKDALELQFGVNFFSLSKTPPIKEIADVLKLETKLKHRVIPVGCVGTQYTIAMVNPDDLIGLDSVRVELKSGHLKKMVCTADEFEYFMRDMYKVNKDGSNSEVEPPKPAAVKPAASKKPAKNQLQSLFDDDDDDEDQDDDDAPAPAAAAAKTAPTAASAPAVESVSAPAQSNSSTPPAVSLPGGVNPPVTAPASLASKLAAVSPAAEIAPAANIAAAASASPTAASAAASAASLNPASASSAAESAAASIQSRNKPAASVTSNSLPAMNTDIMLGPSAAQSLQKEGDDSAKGIAVGDKQKPTHQAQGNGSSPPAVHSAKPPEIPAELPSLLMPDDNPSATQDQIAIDFLIEDVVAGVASEILESSESSQVLNNNALLEEVVESELGGLEDHDINKLKEQQNSSIMLLAHEIIGKATQKRCSDIHLEPDANGVTLRYFLHGELLADCVLPGEIHGALVSSYKIIAGLDPNELEKPQDKKITTKVEDDQVELRITTLPSKHGELVAISMRFIDS